MNGATVHRVGREEITLRLGEDERAVSATPAPDFFRYVNETPKFHLYANLIRSLGGDPEAILRGWLEKRTRRVVKACGQVNALIEAERERLRKGGKARGPANERHRKKLFRAFGPLLPSAKLRHLVLSQLRDSPDLKIVVQSDGIVPRVTLGPYTLGREKSVPRK